MTRGASLGEVWAPGTMWGTNLTQRLGGAMNPGLAALAVTLSIGAALYVGVAGYVFHHRQAVGGRALTVLLLAAGVWTICAAVEVSLPDPRAQALWGALKYLGIVLLPPALLSFALQYTGRRRRIGRRLVALLLVEPVVVLSALALPATRQLVRYVPADAPPGQYAVAQVGALFWVNLVYSYLLIVAAITILVIGLLGVRGRGRRRAWLLISVSLLPLLLNAAYNLGLDDVVRIDPTPLGFSVAALVLVWGFFRFRLLDLTPVGRHQVVERLPDAVLVLDTQGRIVDSNPAAAALVGRSGAALVGRELLELLPQLTSLAGSTSAAAHASGGVRVPAASGGTLHLSVTVSPLPDDSGPPTGRLVVLRDVTVQRDVERRLRALVEERTEIIETLQRGLYPARLPQIPGLLVEAVLDPAETETSVGGDFVDVRASGPGRWTLMVGDVVGKGASAATLTALARHTTVALTALGWSPATVLTEVSRAIADDERSAGAELEARFCTIALATVEPDDGGARVMLALGGHPRPLLVTATGGVTEVGVPGSLLGVLDDPELHDVRVHLGPGECLVLFTDGVTEARRGPEAFGEHRLAELLASLAGEPPARIVHAVVQAVRSFNESGDVRDDVAVLALAVPAAVAGP